MAARSSSRTVIFKRAFRLHPEEGEHPAGSYTVETEEWDVPGIAWRPVVKRMSTVMLCGSNGGMARFATVDPAVLAAAIVRDAERS